MAPGHPVRYLFVGAEAPDERVESNGDGPDVLPGCNETRPQELVPGDDTDELPRH